MFAKLLATLLGVGLTSGALLVNRQHRIDVAVEISRCGDRLRMQETSIAMMQAEIAAAVRPDRLADALATLHETPDSDGPAATDPETESAPLWIAIPTRFDPIPLAPLAEPGRVGS